jgi:hypothetical protein
VERVQQNDVVLSVSPVFFNHHGTSWFVNIMVRIEKVFIKAEIGYLLARKVREEVVKRGGRFFSRKRYDPIASLQLEENNENIELRIVYLLEGMESIYMKGSYSENVKTHYPIPSQENLNPPPNHSDVFFGPLLTLGVMDNKPPGNIRLLRMIQDRCALCPSTEDWTDHARDVIYRVHSQKGRFFRHHQDTGWNVENDSQTLLSLVISVFQDVCKERGITEG